MGQQRPIQPGPPRIERLRIQNFRTLQDVEFKNLTPLTVLLGPNGSGKSTVFNVFTFLAECFESGLPRAWDKQGRARELKSRGADGPILIEIAYRERPRSPLMTYHLELDEVNNSPVVVQESLRWRPQKDNGLQLRLLDYTAGQGEVITRELPADKDKRILVPLSAPDVLAVNILGQLAENPRIVALRNFITGWHVSYFSAEDARGQSKAGAQEQLSKTGDNLANVIQYLSAEHPECMELIIQRLREWVPKFEQVRETLENKGLPAVTESN